jgi:AAA ATPase domain
MILAALYIHDHEYLFDDTPQTLNFGGKYYYSFSQVQDRLLVTRTVNPVYIPNLYSVTPTNTSIKQISAVVGENGAGKSSIMDLIRSMFIENIYALPGGALTAALVEEGDNVYILYSNDNVYLVHDEIQFLKLNFIEKEDFQTIYYSPHLDLKYNFNFSDVDRYDISLDETLATDLEDIDRKGPKASGHKYEPKEELSFKRVMRLIHFLSSDIVKNNKIFTEVFNVPSFEYGTIFFRDYIIDDDFDNVPSQFRGVIKLILKKLEDESSRWHEIRIRVEKRVENQADINKYLLNRFIIKSFLSVIIRQMDLKNTWLEEGVFPDPYQLERFNNYSAKQIFDEFISQSFIEKGSRKYKIFQDTVINEFFSKISQILEKVNQENDVDKTQINATLDDIKDILNLHHKIRRQLYNYYPKVDGILEDRTAIDGFISFRITGKRMSSGENALLNLFSTLYDFINENLIEDSKFLPSKKHYILLLDEADLGFHPTWKKKFINSLIYTLPYFFDSLELQPSLQIVFTTHDPLTLSDLPNGNIIYLTKDGNSSKILKVDDPRRPSKTFGANISDLLASSFFVNDGLIGDFAKDKIEETIEWISNNKTSAHRSELFEEEMTYYKSLITIIDEHIIKVKLSEMIAELDDSNDFHKQVLDREIAALVNKRNRLL